MMSAFAQARPPAGMPAQPLAGSHSRVGQPRRATTMAAALACILSMAWLPAQAQPADPDQAQAQVSRECAGGAELIHTLQGAQATSPRAGETVVIDAVAVGVFQAEQSWGGVFVQEEDAQQDADPRTSEALFVNTSQLARQPQISLGDRLRVRGVVRENHGLTELLATADITVCAREAPLPAATELRLPVAGPDEFERLESMRVVLPQALVITDLYDLWRFGSFAVASSRPAALTQLTPPASGSSTSQPLDSLLIDDGMAGRYLPVRLQLSGEQTPFGAASGLRSGQHIENLAGVLHYAYDAWRLQPLQPPRIDPGPNPRVATPPSTGGKLTIATFNVLNYFSTLADAGPRCGPRRDESCRGAANRIEQQRQLQKISAALVAIPADVFGLMELENNASQSLQDIAGALNQSSPADRQAVYRWVETGTLGRDVIKVGLLFNANTVVPHGPFAVLDSRIDPRFDDSLNRPALAQTFRVLADDALITVIVTHLKSKGCSDAVGANADAGDGQGCYNPVRRAAAEALADWALSGPVAVAANEPDDRRPPVLLLGDFNSYLQEDPIRRLQQQGLVNLLPRFAGQAAYSYVYAGHTGTLDYVFSSPQLVPAVTGAAVWHINADEAAALDYRLNDGKPDGYFAADPFRSSDHDPLLVGLDTQLMRTAGMATAGPQADSPADAEAGWLEQPWVWIAGLLLLVLLAVSLLARLRRQPAD